jgi:DNA-binding MarR family transcriptional regulator
LYLTSRTLDGRTQRARSRPAEAEFCFGSVDAMTGPDIASISKDWERELPGLDIHVFQLSSLLTRLADLMEQEFQLVARENQLRPGDLRVLLALARSGPGYALSPVRLVHRLMITSGGVSKQIDRLAELGLVRRTQEYDGSRGTLVHLEPEGRRIAIKAMTRICATYGGLEELDKADAQSLIDRLQGLYEHVNRSLQQEAIRKETEGKSK